MRSAVDRRIQQAPPPLHDSQNLHPADAPTAVVPFLLEGCAGCWHFLETVSLKRRSCDIRKWVSSASSHGHGWRHCSWEYLPPALDGPRRIEEGESEGPIPNSAAAHGQEKPASETPGMQFTTKIPGRAHYVVPPCSLCKRMVGQKESGPNPIPPYGCQDMRAQLCKPAGGGCSRRPTHGRGRSPETARGRIFAK